MGRKHKNPPTATRSSMGERCAAAGIVPRAVIANERGGVLVSCAGTEAWRLRSSSATTATPRPTSSTVVVLERAGPRWWCSSVPRERARRSGCWCVVVLHQLERVRLVANSTTGLSRERRPAGPRGCPELPAPWGRGRVRGRGRGAWASWPSIATTLSGVVLWALMQRQIAILVCLLGCNAGGSTPPPSSATPVAPSPPPPKAPPIASEPAPADSDWWCYIGQHPESPKISSRCKPTEGECNSHLAESRSEGYIPETPQCIRHSRVYCTALSDTNDVCVVSEQHCESTRSAFGKFGPPLPPCEERP